MRSNLQLIKNFYFQCEFSFLLKGIVLEMMLIVKISYFYFKIMTKEKNSYFDLVYDVTRLVPEGRVTTYGAIADYLSLGSARMVGWALNALNKNHDVPAHRVVNRLGELSGRIMFPTPTAMQERLECEGISVKNDKVEDFKKLFWHPSEIEL